MNTALRARREAMGLSQERFAGAVRLAGDEIGMPNACDKRRVQRWESGTVARPHGVYVLALQRVTGLPVTALGFKSAAEEQGIDEAAALDTGGQSWITVPDPKAAPGPLSGVWLSSYEYGSTSRQQTYTGRHYVVVLQHGGELQVRSVPASASRLRIDLTLDGNVATGTWSERTSPGGYYRGATYHGAIQLLGDPAGQRLDGKWVGFGKGAEVNSGRWVLERVTRAVTAEEVQAYDRVPDEEQPG